MHQIKEAVGDDVYKLKNEFDLKTLAKSIDEALGQDKINDIKKDVEKKQQYVQYLWSVMGQGYFQEYSQDAHKNLEYFEGKNEIPATPAKFTIKESECANNTCQ